MAGGDHQVVQADVTDVASVERLVSVCGDRLDIVVNNAGAISHIPFAELSLEEWHRIVDTDLTATFLVTQKALPLLASGGSVVNVGSKVATVGIPVGIDRGSLRRLPDRAGRDERRAGQRRAPQHAG